MTPCNAQATRTTRDETVMIRYMLAGMATVAGLVLLFLGSFGSSPVPAGARDGGKYASLESGAPGETVEALREQLARARKDLAALEARKQAPPPASAEKDPAVRTPPSIADTPPRAPSTPGSNTSPSKPADEGRAAARIAEAPHPTPASSPGRDDAAARQQTPPAEAFTSPAAKPTKSAATASSSDTSAAPTVRQQDRSAEPTQPFGFPRKAAEARTAAAPPRQPHEDVVTTSREPATPPPSAPSVTDDVVERLRRQALAAPASRTSPPLPAALPPPLPAPRAGPHRIPTEERLADARLAVLEGRVEDARRFLQAAQVQLVFQPADPGDAPPPASLASGPVGQALAALGYGDRGRALVAIDQAIGVLNGLGRLGSTPGQQADAGRSPLPLPTPRSWP